MAKRLNKEKKRADLLTDQDIEREIERLRNSEAVKIAQAEQRYKYRRRQYCYQLRWYENRGEQLMAMGIHSVEDIENGALERLETGADSSDE